MPSHFLPEKHEVPHKEAEEDVEEQYAYASGASSILVIRSIILRIAWKRFSAFCPQTVAGSEWLETEEAGSPEEEPQKPPGWGLLWHRQKGRRHGPWKHMRRAWRWLRDAEHEMMR